MRHLTAKKFAHLEEIEAHEIGRPHFRMRNPLVQGLGDYRVEPIWDIYLIAASTACVKEILFSIPQNNQFQIPGGAAFNKTVQSTSMLKSAELPSPERYILRAISVYLANNMNQDDVSQFCSQTYLSVFMGSSGKSFFQVPACRETSGGRRRMGAAMQFWYGHWHGQDFQRDWKWIAHRSRRRISADGSGSGGAKPRWLRFVSTDRWRADSSESDVRRDRGSDTGGARCGGRFHHGSHIGVRPRRGSDRVGVARRHARSSSAVIR